MRSIDPDKKILDVKIRLSTDDKRHLKTLAKRAGKPAATYLRSLLREAARQTGLT